MLVIKILASFALFGSIAWAITAPGYDSIISAITSLSALISAFIFQKKKVVYPSQKQSVSGDGFGLQAGGDLNVGNISISNEREPNAR